jgi:hypothetical protein
MQPPNLFDFATSELSQDAFICWLASWADPSYRDDDEALHATAFLDRLLETGGVPKPAALKNKGGCGPKLTPSLRNRYVLC